MARGTVTDSISLLDINLDMLLGVGNPDIRQGIEDPQQFQGVEDPDEFQGVAGYELALLDAVFG